MRVVFTIPDFGPRVTGPARVVKALAEGFQRHGHDCIILTTGGIGRDNRTGKELEPPQLDRVAPAVHVGGRRAEVTQRLDQLKPDVVMCHEIRNPLTRHAADWAWRHGIRLAIQPHGGVAAYRHLPHPWQRWPYRGYDFLLSNRRFLRDAYWISTSRQEESEVREVAHPAKRVLRFYLGTDDIHGAAPRPSPQEAKVLILGNLGGFRDPRLVLRAVQILKSKGQHVRLVIAGPFQRQSRFSVASAPRELNEAVYLGRVPHARLETVYQSADLFCYPSRYESFGLPILEAAAAGLPIVATRVGIAPELDIEGETGVLLRSVEPRDIAHGLRAALMDLPRLSRRAHERSATIRTWARWERRLRPFLAWLEGGVPIDDPPEALGTRS